MGKSHREITTSFYSDSLIFCNYHQGMFFPPSLEKCEVGVQPSVAAGSSSGIKPLHLRGATRAYGSQDSCPEHINSILKAEQPRKSLALPVCDMTQQGTQGKDMSSGECRAVRGKKKGLQGLQAALVREIAFCVWLTKLLCLINRLCSEAVSGNRLRHGTGTFPGCWGSTSML